MGKQAKAVKPKQDPTLRTNLHVSTDTHYVYAHTTVMFWLTLHASRWWLYKEETVLEKTLINNMLLLKAKILDQVASLIRNYKHFVPLMMEIWCTLEKQPIRL